MNDIQDLEHEIRNHINDPRIRHGIMQDRRDWMQLCAALDVIGDTQLAIESYLTTAVELGSGLAYLHIFGLFQSFFLQQDATTHLAEVLRINLPEDAGLAEARNSRSDVVGHPTKRGNHKSRTTHAISRITLAKASFDVVSTTPVSADIKLRSIDVSRQIDLQRNGIANRLRLILGELQDREREHAMAFADQKLAHIFPQTLPYHFEKLIEGIHNALAIPLAKGNLDLISGWVETFRSALTERGELPANEVVQFHFDRLRNPLQRLSEFFAHDSPFNADDAYATAFYLQDRVEHLAELAADFDDSYAASQSM